MRSTKRNEKTGQVAVSDDTHEQTDTKRRRKFKVKSGGLVRVKGVLYDEGNCQVFWRADIGWTAQQYHNIYEAMMCLPDLNVLEWE